jgi:hypothetical protein
MENTELVLSLLIPTVASSVEGQILTLKHTLYKLRGLPSWVKIDVSLGTLKYMQSLESQKTHGLMQSILDGLTETELGVLQNLVEYAKRRLENLEYEKSITLFKEMDKDSFKVYLPTFSTNNTGV